MPRDRILILGGSGFVGRELSRQLGPARTLTTFRRHPVSGAIRFDALTESIENVVESPDSFSHAVVMLGNTNPDSCARSPAESRLLNVTRAIEIVDWLSARGIVPVFTSTEAVFDGRRGRYREEDPPHPLMLYGAQKVEVEQHLQRCAGPWLIVRLPRVYGETRGDATLFTSWLAALEEGREIRCASDHIFSPIHVEDAATGLIRLMALGAAGLFHLSSERPLARIDMLRMLVDSFRKRRAFDSRIVPCRMAEFPTLEPRPADCSLDPEKFVRTTHMRPRSVAEFCEDLASRWL